MAGLKEITIPESITFKNPFNLNEVALDEKGVSVTVTFVEFVYKFLNLDVFKSKIEDLRTVLDLTAKIHKELVVGEKVVLNADDLQKLVLAVKENFLTTYTLPPLIMVQLLPFLDVLLNASSV